MSNGIPDETARKLMETASFELDTNLRLHPQKLELGKAELLTDALTLPFVDIEKKLSQYIIGASPEEEHRLRKSMKSYLARLNSNPLIPLHFRLKVLDRFERELELFDPEMTAAVLNAHKIGVEMVQKAAREHEEYYPILVEMVANAIELAVKIVRIALENYQAPAVLATRQVFELARLGLRVVPLLSKEDISEKQRLFKAICNHEFLRLLDFFGKSRDVQKKTWNELQHHVSVLEPHFYRKGEQPDLTAEAFLLSAFSRPNDPAKVVSKLPSPIETDAIIIPLDEFIDRLITAISRVETVLHSKEMQQTDLFTEDALHTTLEGGNALLDALRTKERKDPRVNRSGSRAIIQWDAAKALVESRSAMLMSDYEYAPSEHVLRGAWSVVNISKHGAGLERVHFEPCRLGVGALVGLCWLPHKGEPMLAFIRWIKEPKPGEQRMGIEFFPPGFKLAKGTLIGEAKDESGAKRGWPLLIKPGKKQHEVLFPDSHIIKGTVFVLTHEEQSIFLKVVEVIKTGINYTLCKVERAKERLSKDEVFF